TVAFIISSFRYYNICFVLWPGHFINHVRKEVNCKLGSGLKVWEADIEANIKVNNLREVTNSIALIKNQPTPDGILSYEIFGTSSQSRRETMAYIDLHNHY